jgi:hypothetical protein
MKDRGRIALSSLAVSVSAAALVAVSGVAKSDPPEPWCHVGDPCSLPPAPHEYYYRLTFEAWVVDVLEGGGPGEGWSYETGNIYSDVGYCGWDTSSPELCSCQGWSGGGNTYINGWEYDGYGDPFNPNSYYEVWGPYWASPTVPPEWVSIPETSQCWRP